MKITNTEIEAIETHLYDDRGSVAGTVNAYGIMTSYAYTAYGELMPDSPAPKVYGYNAEATDYTTGLQYLRARYYRTDIQRFVQGDDYKGKFTRPASMNRYIYTEGNPVRGIDPSGYGTIDDYKYQMTQKSNQARSSNFYTEYYSKKAKEPEVREVHNIAEYYKYIYGKETPKVQYNDNGEVLVKNPFAEGPSYVTIEEYNCLRDGKDLNSLKEKEDPDDYIPGKKYLCNNEDEYLSNYNDKDSPETIEELLIMAMNSTSDEDENEKLRDLIQIGRNNGFADFETKYLNKVIITMSESDDSDKRPEELAYDLAAQTYDEREYQKYVNLFVPDKIESKAADKIIGYALGSIPAFVIVSVKSLVDTTKKYEKKTSQGAEKPGIYYDFEIVYEVIESFSTSDGEQTYYFTDTATIIGFVGPDDDKENRLNDVEVERIETSPYDGALGPGY